MTYNYRIKRVLNIQAKLGGNVSHVKTNGNSVTDLFLTPSLRLTYTHKGHSLSVTGTARSKEASNANRIGDEYSINEYETFVGNPALEDYMNYQALAVYGWSATKAFTLLAAATFELNSKTNYRTIEYDANRNSFVNRYINRGTSWEQHYEVGLQ